MKALFIRLALFVSALLGGMQNPGSISMSTFHNEASDKSQEVAELVNLFAKSCLGTWGIGITLTMALEESNLARLESAKGTALLSSHQRGEWGCVREQRWGVGRKGEEMLKVKQTKQKLLESQNTQHFALTFNKT